MSQPKKRRNKKVKVADFSLLDLATLKRYKNHFKLRQKQTSNKSELVQTIQKHFSTLQVDHNATISTFLRKLQMEDEENAN